MPQETLNSQTEMVPINQGTFQEYDYTCEDAECEWKQDNITHNHCVINDDNHDWGG